MSGIEIFIEASDAPVSNGANNASREPDLDTVGPPSDELMLLDKTAFKDMEPTVAIDARGNVLDKNPQGCGIVSTALFSAVGIVPNLRVRIIAIEQCIYVAILYGVKK